LSYGCRLGFSAIVFRCCCLVLVASEMVGAKAGLGYLIINSQYSILIPQMYFGILGITVPTILADGTLNLGNR
jgi:ABC-type nitrate/sulfonate/bicarbonate transport system permease component